MSKVTLKHNPVKKLAPLTTWSNCLRCIGSRAPHFRTVLQNGQDKTSKASPKKQSIMEYLPGLPHDTKPWRSCSGNRAMMLLKSHLEIKCHSQYNNNKVIRLLSTVPPVINMVTPLTNLDKVTAPGLCYCNCNAWGWHNSYQSGVIGKSEQLFFPKWCTGGTITAPKHWPVAPLIKH